MEVLVESRAGAAGEAEPVAFVLGGRRVELACTIDRWLARDHSYFKVETTEGDTYILRHDIRGGRWEITLFRSRRA